MDTILSVEKLNVYYKNKESLSARFRQRAEKNAACAKGRELCDEKGGNLRPCR